MPTNNPVPSQSPDDLVFNAQKLDEALNSDADTFTDRLGNVRRTIPALERQFPDAEANMAATAVDRLAVAADRVVAEGARDQAVDAAQVAITQGNPYPIFPTIAAGIAATSGTDNKRFMVFKAGADALEFSTVFENVAGTAVPRDTFINGESVRALAGRQVENDGDVLWGGGDGAGYVGFGFTVLAQVLAAEAILGPRDALQTSWLRNLTGQLEAKYVKGLKLSEQMIISEADLAGTDHEGALEVVVDPAGYIGEIRYTGGKKQSTETPIDNKPFARLLSATTLPDGARNGNPNGGYTCTGLDIDGRGLWITGNHGLSTESTPVSQHLPSIVILHPDFRRIFKEIPCNVDQFPGIRSIQGVAWDSSDNTIWFVDQFNKTFRHITFDGVKLSDEIVVPWEPNGCAYDPVNDALWVNEKDTNNAHLISCANKQFLKTLDRFYANSDQLHYDPIARRLWCSHGANGYDGSVTVFNVDNGRVVAALTDLTRSHAIEGIKPIGNRLYVLNDSAYHVNPQSPPLALACEYEYSLGI